jgi:glutamyl-tRNA reductase
MNILVVGLSHKTAPVDIRERVAFAPTEMEKPLQQLLALPAVAEAVIVSTCNRVEIYATSRDAEGAIGQIKRFLSEFHNIAIDDLEPHLYDRCGGEAIHHLFRVAASLDSMIVGEPQILGQIKTAYGYATEFKSVGLILNRFLHKAFSVAKRVRTETEIASNAVSVSFAAVELARKIFGQLEGKTVMLIGAGEMCELAARHFVNNGVTDVLVTNRTFERAEKLAGEFNGRPVLFENFADHLDQVDIVLASTGAPDFILEHATLEAVIKKRRNRPMFMIDIAVPRDIDPRINDIDNIYLYDVDDLQEVIQANMKERQKEAKKAEVMILAEVDQFHQWLGTLDVVPTIVALRTKFEQIRKEEVQKTLSRFDHFSKKERKAIEAMTSAIINKALHHPVTLLKQCNDETACDAYVDAVRTLFDLAPVETEEKQADTDEELND